MGFPRILRQHSSVVLSLLCGLLVSYVLTIYTRDRICVMNDDAAYAEEDFGVHFKNENDEYEPRINLAGKPQKAKKLPRNLVRPRYYSTELGMKDKLLMGVLTKETSVRTLALAANRTASRFVDKLMFFIDAAGAQRAKVIELKLPGIVGFVDTKEILKPFHVLKYLTDNFLEEYDFFFLVRDTTYVNTKTLGGLLKKISVSENVHTGEVISDSSGYCSLNGGILLSNSVLKRIQGSLDWCVKNAFSDNDDDNLGRCILHASEQPCTNVVQGNSFESKFLDDERQRNLEILDLGSAISYYPIKSDKVFYKIHLLFSKILLLEAQKQLFFQEHQLDLNSLSWPPGSYPPKLPSTRFDLLTWQRFDMEKLYLPSDFVNVKPLKGPDLQDTLFVVNRSTHWLMNRYPGELRYRRLVNGYRRFDPSRGLDYVLDLAFKDSSGRETIKRVEACKPLGRVEMLQMPYVTESSRIYLLLPVQAEDLQNAIDFMTKYSQGCSQTELTYLLLILLYDPNAPGKGHVADVFKEIKSSALELSSKKHKDCKIPWISIKIPEIDGGVPLEDYLLYFAMTDLVSKKLSSESLVLYTEPNMELRTDYLKRVRMGTILGKQVYSPIPFSEFNPKIIYRNESWKTSFLEIHKNTGRFDKNNKRHLSFYLSDYLEARANIPYIPIVKADKDIAKMFSTYKKHNSPNPITSVLDMFARLKISVLRATEPSLRLHWNECNVERNNRMRRVTEYDKCGSQIATRSQLGQIVLDLIGNTTFS